MLTIKDSDALEPKAVPSEVVRRNAALNTMAAAYDPLKWGEVPNDVRLFGPPGAGKTALARYWIEHELDDIAIKTRYIDCVSNCSRWAILARALDEIQSTHDLHRTSTPVDVLTSRLHDWTERPFIVVLDEADQVAHTGVFDDFYSHPTISVVLISNDETQLVTGLDERVKSRIREAKRVPLHRYHRNELQDILATRTAEAFASSAVISDSLLKRITEAAAGDARAAIGALQKAARQARSEREDAISKTHVETAIDQIGADPRKPISEYPEDHQVLYHIVEEEGEIAWGDLYDRYADTVEDPVVKKTAGKYRDKLVYYDQIETKTVGRETVVRLK
jgi:Cdc6-like AAA superfamily ATPase